MRPDPDATVSGPASALLLLWGRIGLGGERIRLDGSAADADRVLRAGIVP